MKRFLLILLALVLFAGCLAACKGKTPGGTQTTAPIDNTVPLPVANYNGKTYAVLSRDSEGYKQGWIADENDTGNTIGKAVYMRNSAVEERYNVDFDFETGLTTVNDTLASAFMDRINQMVMAGENTFQLAAGYSYVLAAKSTEGNFLNWYTVPTVRNDLDKEWWDEEFLLYATYRGCSYIASGSLSLSAMKGSACLFFDEDALDRYKPDSKTEGLFDLVRDGKWTIDQMMEYAADCTPGTEGDPNAKTYGFASNRNENIDAFVYAFNMGFTGYNENNDPYILSIRSGNLIESAYDKIKKFIDSGNYWYVDKDDPDYGDGHVSWLLNRRTVFAAGLLENAEKLRMDPAAINYGILPYPKWNEEQEEYLTYKTHSHTDFAIPKTVKEVGGDAEFEFVGTITDALAYYSNLYVKDALYNVVLKYHDARDENSSYSVDLILKGGRYDFANIYAFVWGDQQGPAHAFRQNLKAGKDALSTTFSAEKQRYDDALKDFLEKFHT